MYFFKKKRKNIGNLTFTWSIFINKNKELGVMNTHTRLNRVLNQIIHAMRHELDRLESKFSVHFAETEKFC